MHKLTLLGDKNILLLFMNLTTSYLFFFRNSGKKFKLSLYELLDVPIWKVRDLVSSALSVLFTMDDVLHELDGLKMGLKTNSISCNKIHGMLLVTQKVLKRNNK